MTGEQKKLKMAYAIGKVFECNENSQKVIMLKEVDDEWNYYEIRSHCYTDGNSNMALYYCGKFGKEATYARLITVYQGWDLEHLVHLLTQAIDMHKKEVKEEQKET